MKKYQSSLQVNVPPQRKGSKIPPIPTKYLNVKYSQSMHLNIHQLFEFFVSKLIILKREMDFFTANQFGNLVFDNYDSPELKKIFTEYNTYFITKGSKRKLDVWKVSYLI